MPRGPAPVNWSFQGGIRVLANLAVRNGRKDLAVSVSSRLPVSLDPTAPMGRKESDSTVLSMYPPRYARWASGASALVPFAPLGLLDKGASSRGLTPTAKSFRPSGTQGLKIIPSAMMFLSPRRGSSSNCLHSGGSRPRPNPFAPLGLLGRQTAAQQHSSFVIEH